MTRAAEFRRAAPRRAAAHPLIGSDPDERPEAWGSPAAPALMSVWSHDH